MAVARLMSVRAAAPVGQLVDRLVQLERRLAAGGAQPARPRDSRDDTEGER
jgi:hypothetical protein